MKTGLLILGLCALFTVGFSQQCDPDEFTCDNGNCIPASWVCDGDQDCGDGSDEPGRDDCPPCDDSQFQCDSGKCINGNYVCDGDNDCRDWSDESADSCPCSDGEWRCPTPEAPPGEPVPPGDCIPPEYICDADGIWDCPDGSDEFNCTTRAAHSISHVLRSAKSIKSKVVKPKIIKPKLW